jgi:dynein heavy chain
MSKRGIFPRLYFLSNDEIIELIGSMDDTKAIQAILYKMFDGCETIDFAEELTDPLDFLGT